MAEISPGKIKVKAINQVGIIVKNIEETVKDYWNILGIGPHIIVSVEPVEGYEMNYRGKKAAYRFKASFCQVGPLEVEFLQSIQGPNIYEDHIREHGEGANHIQSLTKSVEEVDEQIKNMSEKGFSLLMDGRFGTEIGFAYIDTGSALKTIWELVKMPDEHTGIPDIYPPPGGEETSLSRIKVKAINHIGIAVEDIEEVAQNYSDLLGIGPWEIRELSFPELHDITLRGKAIDPRWKVGKAETGQIQLELIQPVSGENIYREFMNKHGEGIHHIQFTVDDIKKTNRIMEEQGFPVLMGGGYLDGGFAYYDTSERLKVIWEAVQIPKDDKG